jgi:hypothetical protein
LRAAGFLAAVFFLAGLRAAVFLRAAAFLATAMLPPFTVPEVVLRRHALQTSTLPFAHAAPDAVALVTAERVVEAFDPNGALTADPLGLPR